MKKQGKKFLALLMALVLCATALCPTLTASASSDSSINRFNVVMVADASGSMNDTDAAGNRYEAIQQFCDILTERGNYLSGVVFNDQVQGVSDIVEIRSKTDKELFIQKLKSVSPRGYTNIGAALTEAMDQLDRGANPSLPSVILFLSDGNTEMPNADATTQALELRDDAVERARKAGVRIYSVCLNYDNSADTQEMKRISDATGGVFMEVHDSGDLVDVFNNFYELIYGSSIIEIVDDEFPDSGVLETPFLVPGIGVEEINIIIRGKVESITLSDPSGMPVAADVNTADTYTLVKTSQVTPGDWVLETRGIPHDKIKVNLVFNHNLRVNLSVSPSDAGTLGSFFTVTATLAAGTVPATSASQYTGFIAELAVLNAMDEELSRVPMALAGDNGFQAQYSPTEKGAYKFRAYVRSAQNYLERQSETYGPVQVIDRGDPPPPVNTPPRPVEPEIVRSVKVWPFFGGKFSLEMAGLAVDDQDAQLTYRVLSSSFLEGEDYHVEGDTIIQDHFSLSKGSYDIRAVDSGGLSCDIHVVVKTINIGIITLIVLGVLALIALAIIIFIIVRLAGTPFYGEISIRQPGNLSAAPITRKPGRGKCYLSAFGVPILGLDARKTYFQATGDRFVWLITPVEVTVNGVRAKKSRVGHGVETNVNFDTPNGKQTLVVSFKSSIPPGRKRPTRGGPAVPGGKGPAGRGPVGRAPGGRGPAAPRTPTGRGPSGPAPRF